MTDDLPARDPFARLRLATRARIGLGRSGDALPTRALLDFQAAHGRARDAVHSAVDFDAIATALAPRPTIQARSRAGDRATYLMRPDLGRQVDPADHAALDAARGDWDVAFVIADGLSAAAVAAHAAPTLGAVLDRLNGWRVAPVVLGTQARVAFGDEAAHRLGAAMVAVLVGERPGLSVADSLGIYLTWQPRPGCPDSARNCISNVHADGLSYAQAADTLVWLMTEGRRRRLTGVALKIDGAQNHAIAAGGGTAEPTPAARE